MECNYESQREEIFTDLSMTVKNIYEKVYNQCLEKAIQKYL